MTEEINTTNCGDMLAVEYFSFGVDHEGFICLVFKEDEDTLHAYPLNVNDEADEKVVELMCKVAGVHPFDLGRISQHYKNLHDQEKG